MSDASGIGRTRAAFREAFSRADRQMKPGSIAIQAGQLYRFVHEIKIGDGVVYPRKLDRSLRFGEIVGDYVHDPEGAPAYPHRRAVRWSGQISRDAFSQGALYELGSVLTLFEVRSYADEIIRKFAAPGRLADIVATEAEDETGEEVGRRIVETTKDFISKKLKGDLKGYPLEPFVAELFRAMGYRAHATRSVRDDGIDVIAHRDELGIEPPVIKIQVKAHEANIGADYVKAFYAMIHERDVGIFIATGGYTAPARDFARTKANMRLIDGIELINLIEKYYDGLDLKCRQQIPLRRVLVPDVAGVDE